MQNSSLLENLRSMGTRWKGFANLGAEAQYDYLSQIISLNGVEASHRQAAESGAPAGRRKVLLPLAHEMTHWLDHISTSWGRRHLVQIVNALHARIENIPAEFYRIVDASDSLRRLGDHNYYKVVGNQAPKLSQTRPWLWRVSCGQRFSADGRLDRTSPIIFNSFYAHTISHKTLIARVPLSALALTEANAMSAEQDWVRREQTRAVSAITMENWQKDASALIYDVEYVIYSSALHCVANHCSIFELASAFAYVRSLATLCLNLPRCYFSTIALPPHLKAVWDHDLVVALRSTGDPGFAFLVLCSWSEPIAAFSPREWIERTLQRAGLPKVDDVENVWLREMEEDVACLPGPFDMRFAALFSAGHAWAVKRGVLGDTQCLLDAIDGQEALPMPDVLLGDGAVWQIGSPLSYNGVRILGTEQWFDALWEQEKALNDFLAACGRGT